MPGCTPGDKAVIIGPLEDDPHYCSFLAQNIGAFVTVDSVYNANPILEALGILQPGPLFKVSSRYALNIHLPHIEPLTNKVIYIHKQQFGDILPDKWLQPIRPIGNADEMNARKELEKKQAFGKQLVQEGIELFTKLNPK